MPKKQKKSSFAVMSPQDQDYLLGVLDRHVQMLLSHHLEHQPHYALIVFNDPSKPGITTNAPSPELQQALHSTLKEEVLKR